jgi:hypothetical protein
MHRYGSTKKIRKEKVRKGSQQARRIRYATEEERNTAKRTQWKEGHESQAGYRNRTF